MASFNFRVGAAWLKKGNDGSEYLSYSIDKEKMAKAIALTPGSNIPVTLKKNNFKSKPNQPDYNVVCIEVKEHKQGGEYVTFHVSSAPANAMAHAIQESVPF